jgi:hypothetical protein
MKNKKCRAKNSARLLISFLLLVMTLVNALDTKDASPSATNANADVATEWFSLSLKLIQETPSFSPPLASRVFGYMGLTLYEAVVPGMAGYQSLAGQLDGLASLPQIEAGQLYDWSVSANSALAALIKKLFPTLSQENKIKIQQLEQHFNSATNPEIMARSVEYGRAVATAIYNWSLEDNSQYQVDYSPSSTPGTWQPTAPAFAKALLPQWGHNRFFVLASEGDCAVSPPISYSEKEDSAFYKEALEVYQTSQILTDKTRQIALFWSDDPGKTATPPGHWMAILTHLITVQNKSLAHAAESYAKLGLALADSFIACWQAKYEYNLVRPISYIQANIDPDWQPLLSTPPFPEYPSGHSVQSAAAAVVLTDLFGEGFAFTDHTHDGHGLPSRSFMSFRQAAEEAALSRFYGGIHFRAAIENGLEQGRCIGEKILGLEFHKLEPATQTSGS